MTMQVHITTSQVGVSKARKTHSWMIGSECFLADAEGIIEKVSRLFVFTLVSATRYESSPSEKHAPVREKGKCPTAADVPSMEFVSSLHHSSYSRFPLTFTSHTSGIFGK